MKYSVSSSEEKIMEVLWDNGQWMTCGELIEYFETKENKIWKRQTINTFLSRMIEKGIVVKHQHKYTYAHTKVEFEKLKATEFLENRYEGSLSKFVAALSGTKKISKEDADALKRYLDELP